MDYKILEDRWGDVIPQLDRARSIVARIPARLEAGEGANWIWDRLCEVNEIVRAVREDACTNPVYSEAVVDRLINFRLMPRYTGSQRTRSILVDNVEHWLEEYTKTMALLEATIPLAVEPS